MNTRAPVVVFSYNRVDKIERCLYSLEKCQENIDTDLFVFSDGARSKEDKTKVEEVRTFLDEYAEKSSFKSLTIIKRTQNIGLKQSIISGVSDVIHKYRKVIVVEDDLVVAPDFLSYMNGGLDYYEELKKYGSICAYSYPVKQLKEYNKTVYVTQKGDCWGWGTWEDRWNDVDWEFKDAYKYKMDWIKRYKFGKLESGIDKLLLAQSDGKGSSWAVIWIYHLYKKGYLSVYPKVSRCKNAGNDGTGEHGGKESKYDTVLSNVGEECEFEDLPVNYSLQRVCAKYSARSFIDIVRNKTRKRLEM